MPNHRQMVQLATMCASARWLTSSSMQVTSTMTWWTIHSTSATIPSFTCVDIMRCGCLKWFSRQLRTVILSLSIFYRPKPTRYWPFSRPGSCSTHSAQYPLFCRFLCQLCAWYGFQHFYRFGLRETYSTRRWTTCSGTRRTRTRFCSTSWCSCWWR